ncbi:MAG: methyltransferase domain-containing protein [Bacteroidota bacterium]
MYLRLLLLLPLLCLACVQPAADCPCDCDTLVIETSDRTAWQKPSVVIETLGDLEEKVVADIGAGHGFFALRLAQMADRVIAIDVTEENINILAEQRDLELPVGQRGRLEPRLAPYEHPNLEAEEVDVVLFVNTFYVIQSVDYLRRVIPGMKPGARLVIVDWKDQSFEFEPPNMVPRSARIAIGETQDMLEAAGFRLVRSYDDALRFQYIVVAEKQE